MHLMGLVDCYNNLFSLYNNTQEKVEAEEVHNYFKGGNANYSHNGQ